MKLAIVSLITTTILSSNVVVLAFQPAFVIVPSLQHATTSTRIFQEATDGSNDGGDDGLDLNLEEMFEMFDAADKGETFDDAAKRIKAGEDEN